MNSGRLAQVPLFIRSYKVNESRHPAPDPSLQSLRVTRSDARNLRVRGSVEPGLGKLDKDQVHHDHSEEEQEEGRRQRREPEQVSEPGVWQQGADERCPSWHNQHRPTGPALERADSLGTKVPTTVTFFSVGSHPAFSTFQLRPGQM
jgi:hypothetical protein